MSGATAKRKGSPVGEDEYEDDDFEEEPSLEALAGAVASAGGTDEVSGLVLEMILGATKLGLLLEELDEIEFKTVGGRLGLLKKAVGGLREGPVVRRKIGFVVEGGAKRKKKRRKRRKK